MELDELTLIEQAVEDGSGKGFVIQRFGPFCRRLIGSDDKGGCFIYPVDKDKETVPVLSAQRKGHHIVNNE